MCHPLNKLGLGCPPHRAVIVAAASSHPGVLIVLGTTALFLGSVIALVMSNELYDEAGWSEGMGRLARWAAYGGAFSLFLAVLKELGSGQRGLQAIMLLSALLTLGLVLITSTRILHRRGRKLIPYVLSGLRPRGKQGGVQEHPDKQRDAYVLVVVFSGEKKGDHHGPTDP